MLVAKIRKIWYNVSTNWGDSMKKLKNYSLRELKELREVFSQYGSMEEMNHDLDTIIHDREETQEKSLNECFDMKFWIENHVFYPWELEILVRNNITNLQELIDCDLDQLDGITRSTKEVFEWARKFYDFTSMEKMRKPSHKK